MKQLIAACCLLLSCLALAESGQFAVIGDIPYSIYERQKMPLMLKEIADQHPAFIVHASSSHFKSLPDCDCIDVAQKGRLFTLI